MHKPRQLDYNTYTLNDAVGISEGLKYEASIDNFTTLISEYNNLVEVVNWLIGQNQEINRIFNLITKDE